MEEGSIALFSPTPSATSTQIVQILSGLCHLTTLGNNQDVDTAIA